MIHWISLLVCLMSIFENNSLIEDDRQIELSSLIPDNHVIAGMVFVQGV
jgi:hypothetical protein